MRKCIKVITSRLAMYSFALGFIGGVITGTAVTLHELKKIAYGVLAENMQVFLAMKKPPHRKKLVVVRNSGEADGDYICKWANTSRNEK